MSYEKFQVSLILFLFSIFSILESDLYGDIGTHIIIYLPAIGIPLQVSYLPLF